MYMSVSIPFNSDTSWAYFHSRAVFLRKCCHGVKKTVEMMLNSGEDFLPQQLIMSVLQFVYSYRTYVLVNNIFRDNHTDHMYVFTF